jgi:hypothetical protein
MNKHYTVIIADGIDDTQQKQFQAAIESKSDSWWHHLENIWIAESDLTTGEWTDLLAILVPFLPSSVLVLALPEKYSGFPRWGAVRMPTTGVDWLREHISQQKKEAPSPET